MTVKELYMYDDLFTANKRETQPAIQEAAGRKSVDDLLMEATMEAEYQPRLNVEKLGESLRKGSMYLSGLLRTYV